MDPEHGPVAPGVPGDWLRAVIPEREGQNSGHGRRLSYLLWTFLPSPAPRAHIPSGLNSTCAHAGV